MKILIADDDRVSLVMIRRMLLQRGYDVFTVGDGAAAVDAVLQPNGPRLLLLDWMMPSMNGLDVCRAIRKASLPGYVYIILLSARDTKEDVVAGLEAGADDFITKPCHAEELTARLRAGQRILQLEDGLIEARDQMRFRATHDALTGILNRGAIVNTLSEHLDARTGSSAVVLCDVDHFKSINDTYGHPVGDEVLSAIARRLGGMLLKGDEVGRFGGEEFLLLLKNVDTTQLEVLGHSLCDSLQAQPVETSAGPLAVTMSAGVLGLRAAETSLDIDAVLSQVDTLLYQAKRGGRNRAVVAAAQPRHPEPRSDLRSEPRPDMRSAPQVPPRREWDAGPTTSCAEPVLLSFHEPAQLRA